MLALAKQSDECVKENLHKYCTKSQIEEGVDAMNSREIFDVTIS